MTHGMFAGTLNPDDALPEATTSGSTSTSDTTVIIETNSAAPNVKTSADTSPFETTTSPVVIEKSITVSYTTDAEPVTVMNPVALKASRQPAQGLLPSINTNTIATVDVAHVEPTTASPATSTRSSHAPRTAGHDVHVIDVTSAANDGILLADHATTEFEVAVKTSAKCVHGTYESTSPLTSTPSTTEDRSKPGRWIFIFCGSFVDFTLSLENLASPVRCRISWESDVRMADESSHCCSDHLRIDHRRVKCVRPQVQKRVSRLHGPSCPSTDQHIFRRNRHAHCCRHLPSTIIQ